MGADISSRQLAFSRRLLDVLRAHPAGISEYELIRTLDTDGESGFDRNCLRDSLSLFQTHFFLFHHLYVLHDHLWRKGEAYLSISPLCIQLLPVSDRPGNELAEHAPLREYYLDINNLKNTDANEVDRLLGRFWSRFVRDDERQNALAELELSDPVDWATIKTQHRRLAMQHHPDRGGDEQRLQAINAAMDILVRDSRNR
ncbi:MAG TPA: molecular chaperone DnaJ [Gammaproteobacteria bacterium]|nr:molecular chaperone DnaJ [Gammaproteobacteria bacterium]